MNQISEFFSRIRRKNVVWLIVDCEFVFAPATPYLFENYYSYAADRTDPAEE
jgi:hypothetical protein